MPGIPICQGNKVEPAVDAETNDIDIYFMYSLATSKDRRQAGLPGTFENDKNWAL